METKLLLGTIITLLILITLTIAAPVMADRMGPSPGVVDRPNGPPPEAFTACEGKKAGDAVTVTTKNGDQIKAICETVNNRLAARPTEPPPKPTE